jgi:hypothetical protein
MTSGARAPAGDTALGAVGGRCLLCAHRKHQIGASFSRPSAARWQETTRAQPPLRKFDWLRPTIRPMVRASPAITSEYRRRWLRDRSRSRLTRAGLRASETHQLPKSVALSRERHSKSHRGGAHDGCADARPVPHRPAGAQRTMMTSRMMVALPYVLVAVVIAYIVNHIFY